MLRDMRWHAQRLDDPSSVESVLTMAGTLSESVKKLSQVLSDPTPESTPPPTGPKIEISAVQNFFAVVHGDATICEECGGIRQTE